MFVRNYISLLWFFVFCVFTCLIFVMKVEHYPKENYSINKFISNFKNTTYITPKKLVAYSLKMIIQSQGREIECPEIHNFSTKSIKMRIWKKVEDTNIYTYASYYDLRLQPYNYIRIIAMVKGSPNSTLFCHLDSNTAIETTIQEMWYKEWDPGDQKTLTPHLISCKIPQHQKNLPKYITISSAPCRNTNHRLKIINNLKRTQTSVNQSVLICVKPLNFNKDITIQLLSWLELNILLGTTNFDVYLTSLHVNTRKLLSQYIKNGILRTFRHKTVTKTGNNVWQRRKYEVITYNDCLYRNIHNYDYILPLDIDEVIIPRYFNTFQQLITNLSDNLLEKYSSFSARNTYFNTNIINSNDSILFLRYLTRSDYSSSEKSGKSLMSTLHSLVIFNHYTLIPLKPGVGRVYFIPKEHVQLNHYKKSCVGDLLPECEEYMYNSTKVYDPIILRYEDKLINNVNKVLNLIKNNL